MHLPWTGGGPRPDHRWRPVLQSYSPRAECGPVENMHTMIRASLSWLGRVRELHEAGAGHIAAEERSANLRTWAQPGSLANRRSFGDRRGRGPARSFASSLATTVAWMRSSGARPRLRGAWTRGSSRIFGAGCFATSAWRKSTDPAARRASDGAALRVARLLRIDHGAIAALLVPAPTPEVVEKIRSVLGPHNALEEEPRRPLRDVRPVARGRGGRPAGDTAGVPGRAHGATPGQPTRRKTHRGDASFGPQGPILRLRGPGERGLPMVAA